MNPKYEKLTSLLKELFQLDQLDLDFGLYRVMHAKREEVSNFLETDLLGSVKTAFHEYRTADRAKSEKELRRAIEEARRHTNQPEDSALVKEARAKLSLHVDVGKLENDVYDHLFSFFRRYYHEGDFHAKRVYKDGVYAVPYEGEEVSLHWANKEQYYIKSSEYLRNYTFLLNPGSVENPMRVHFQLTGATEEEHSNIKSSEEKKRVFVLSVSEESEHDFLRLVEGEYGKELVIRFEYRPATLDDLPTNSASKLKKPPSQRALISLAVERILATSDPKLFKWISALGETHTKSNGDLADYSRLEANLQRYTARNTFDYFIHKDLEAFLRRELDFYIKNEVMNLDDVENESAPRVEQYLSKIKVIRKIAGKIIDFLAQVENFQKKLWMKKKFVVDTQYCVKLDHVPNDLYPLVVANEEQQKEWDRLFGIRESQIDQNGLVYSSSQSEDFRKRNRNLVIDTKFFDDDFKNRLVASIEDFDDQCDGLLVHSENSQALNLLQTRFRERIKCIYIDPPYNTSENSFLYKNSYKHSSWISMMANGLRIAPSLMPDSGVLIGAIDDTEYANLKILLSDVFGADNYVGSTAVEVNPAGQNIRPNVPARSHDYFHIFARDIEAISMRLRNLTDEERGMYSEEDSSGKYYWDNLRRRGGNSRPKDRRHQWYPLYVKGENVRVPEMDWNDVSEVWVPREKPNDDEKEIWPIDPQGENRIWRVNPNGARREIAKGEILAIQKAGRSEVSKKSREPEGKKPKTLWAESKYSATSHGTKLLLNILGSEVQFSYPKSIHLTTDAVRYWADETAVVLDFFAGSGTTGHAVINLNREDGGKRQFILVEMGEYFDSVLLPRLKKIIFTPEWLNGKPKRLATEVEIERSPRIIKVVRLESYEDTLDNLVIHRTDEQQSLLDSCKQQENGDFREDYYLRYMLDVETRCSQSLLNSKAFSDPTTYKLKVKRPGSEGNHLVNVDLIETFNWLLGISIRCFGVPQNFVVEVERDGEKRLRLTGSLKPDQEGPHWFRTVSGSLPDGRKALIIWRKITGDLECDNLVLNEWFLQQGYSDNGVELDLVYVNGSNNLEILKGESDLWKVCLIEEHFHRLMFDIEKI